MAASQIPNLNTLRNGRGGRGRGRGLASVDRSLAPTHEEEKAAKDTIVQQTDQDASISRLSAVEVGYLDDPFAKLFVSSERYQRRFPIINRGTYVRTKTIDQLVDSFLSTDTSQKKQIISLGAGSDTRFFRLMRRDPGDLSELPNFIYHEIDFPENTAHKISIIHGNSQVSQCIQSPHATSSSKDTFESSNYHIHPVDLRTLDPLFGPPLSFQYIDRDLPTLLISECCLVYLSPTTADKVALYFTQHLFPPSTPLGLVLYEPINPHDPFGKVMVSNLAARGIVLQTLRKYGSLEAQAARMKAYGLGKSTGADINVIWKRGVGEEEKERVGALEMVDEVEEWELLAGHYCVFCGWRDREGEEEQGNWKGWEGFPEIKSG